MSKVEKAYNKTDDDSTKTAGLEKVVRLSVGAKVMLKKQGCGSRPSQRVSWHRS